MSITLPRILNKIVREYSLFQYRRSLPKLVEAMRKKEKIRVLFVLSDLSLWKTEGLYKEMLNHPRFEPIIGTALITADVASESIKKYNTLISYLNKNKYPYVEMYNMNICLIGSDITFYQQPYEGFLSETISFKSLIAQNSLICDIYYALHTLSITTNHNFVINCNLHNYSWLLFYENELTAQFRNLSPVKGRNICVTGVPFQDEISKPSENFSNPWKEQSRRKKRIIFAPHHTIPTQENCIDFSTFLDVSEVMLELASKYSDTVQFAFKPHPFLKKKLVDIWGKEKTEKYYNEWATRENCQIVEGEYMGLFKHSDALIHDCGSFTVEYCYERKPAMFLVAKENIEKHTKELNEFGQKAFELHCHGVTCFEIENFIKEVLSGEDKMKDAKEEYYNNYLLPPHGKTASQNIINAILGEEEYKLN